MHYWRVVADYGSSAKDQLSGTSVAIKKIKQPFSSTALSKKTYRELKLLKHLRHDNVRPAPWRRGLQGLARTFPAARRSVGVGLAWRDLPFVTVMFRKWMLMSLQIISLSDIFISPLQDM
jgi:serine/threonine protein kinase